ncbi:MAG: hypothetical protein IPM06_18640 [Rhizobiales bacterium]|nr:hypothetical protein [Hyphomicrobiales bacterium]
MGKLKKQVVDVLSMLASEDGDPVAPAKIEEQLSGKSDALVDLFAKDLGYEGDSFSRQYGGAFEPDAPVAPASKTEQLFGRIKPLLTGSADSTGAFKAGGKQEAESNRTIEGIYNETIKAVKGRVGKILGQDANFKPMLSPLGRILNAPKVEEATKQASADELGRVVDLNSAERFVRDLASGGMPQDGTLNKVTGALNAGASPVRRSAIGKIGPGLTNTFSLPSIIGRGKTKFMEGDVARSLDLIGLTGAHNPVEQFNTARDAADAGLLPSLAGAAAEGELDAVKAKAYANIPLTEQEQTILDRENRGLGSKIGGAVGDIAHEAWRDPANFLQQQGDALGDPFNAALMLATGGAAGARSAAARSAGNMAARAKLIPKAGIPLGKPIGALAEVGAVGALAQAGNEGRITTEGVVGGIPLAVATSAIGRIAGGRRARAEGGAAPRPDETAAPTAPRATVPTPDAPPIITPIPDVTIPPPDATSVPRTSVDGTPIPDALPAAFVPEQPRAGPTPEPGPSQAPKAKGRKGSRMKRTATGADVSPARAAAQTQSIVETARREAQHFSDAGDPELARSIIERTRPMQEALHGPDAQRAMDATLADIAATTERRQRGKAKEKPKQIPMDNPPMDKEAARKAIEEARREAQYYARNGELDVANKVIDDAADAFKAKHGDDAPNAIETEKRIVAKQVPAKKADPKPAKVKPKVPASTEEAVAIVQESQDKINQAVADGDAEAVRTAAEEASEAMKVVHPEGDVAATKTQEIVQEAEARIEAAAPPPESDAAPAPTTPDAPSSEVVPDAVPAPEPKAPKTKKPKQSKEEDPIALARKLRGGEPDGTESKERLTVEVRTPGAKPKTLKFSSEADYKENPVTAALNDFQNIRSVNHYMGPSSPFANVETRVAVVNKKLNRYSENITKEYETPDGPKTYAELAEEGTQHVFDAITDGDVAPYEAFLAENNLTPKKFAEIIDAASMPIDLQSEIGAIKEVVKNGRDGAARRGGQTMALATSLLGAVASMLGVDDAGLATMAAAPILAATPEASRAVATSVGNVLTNIGDATQRGVGKLETRSNRLDRKTLSVISESGNKKAVQSAMNVGHKTRRATATADDFIGKYGGAVRQAYEGIPSYETSAIGQMDIPIRGIKTNDAVYHVTDAIEGKKDPSTFSPPVKRLYDAAKNYWDATRAWNEKLTGRKGRDNFVPRLEKQFEVYELTKKATEQYGDSFPDNEATTTVSARIPDPVDPVVDAAVRAQADDMMAGFEVMPDGTLALTIDDNGRPVLENRAWYLWELDDEHGDSMKPHLPEIFKTDRVKDADGNETTIPVLRKDKAWTKEMLYDLLKTEGIRLLTKRHSVDPNAPAAHTGMSRDFKSKRWQLDPSLTGRRLMPYLGDQFYNRNIMDLIAHTGERQARGLARIEEFGRDRSGLLRPMQRIRAGVPRSKMSDAELGVVMMKDGSYRLAIAADGDAYMNSIVRDIDDAAMGYARPYMDATTMHKISRIASQMVRFPLLLGKLTTAVPDATYQVTSAANIGLGTEFGKQRLGVASHQMPGGFRSLASSILEGAAFPAKLIGADKALRDKAASIRYHDPMWEYMQAGLVDNASILGSNPLERATVQAQRIFGAFSRNAEGAAIAARLAGIEWLKGWVAEAKRTGRIRKGDADNVLTEGVHRSISRADIRELMALIDENGEPRDEGSARRFLQVAAPFADEVASQINGSSNVFHQPRITSSLDAKNWAFMMMTPLTLASNAIANINRASKGNRSKLGKVASVSGRTARLAATSAAGSLAKTGIMATNPALAATLLAIATGSVVPVGIAALTTGAWKDTDKFDVNNERAEASWNYLKGVPSSDAADMMGAAARLTATGLPVNPRFLDLNIMPKEVSDAAGFRAPPGASGAKFVGSMLEPGLSALADETYRRGTDLKLAYSLAKNGGIADAIQLATASTFLPSTREMAGMKFKDLREGMKPIDAREKKRDDIELARKPYVPGLKRDAKVRKKTSKIKGVRAIKEYE